MFRDAAAKYLNENLHKSRIRDDALHLKQLDPEIGHLLLRKVHGESLKKFVAQRRAQGRKIKTVNHALAVVRRILNLASTEWRDENGLTWLETAPKIRLLPITDARAPYPLSFEEQALLFKELPGHLGRMALFKVNTGCRDQEVCRLRWEWEIPVPEMGTSVFLIPAKYVKNREDRLVVLNSVAKSVIDEARGQHAEWVFVYKGNPVNGMNNNAWHKARKRTADKLERRTRQPAPWGFRNIRVHDLKHTFGRRLRSAGVSFEDRQDLLGHRSGRITTHYSQAELENLIAASERVCALQSRKTPTLVMLKGARVN